MPSIKSLKATIQELSELFDSATVKLPIPFKDAICHEELTRLILPALRYLPKVTFGKNGRPVIILETLGLDIVLLKSIPECEALITEISKKRLKAEVQELNGNSSPDLTKAEKAGEEAQKEVDSKAPLATVEDDPLKLALSLYLLLIELRLDIIQKLKAKKRANWIAQNETNLSSLAESIRHFDRSLKQLWHTYAIEECEKSRTIEDYLGAYIEEEEPGALDSVDFYLAQIYGFLLTLR